MESREQRGRESRADMAGEVARGSRRHCIENGFHLRILCVPRHRWPLPLRTKRCLFPAQPSSYAQPSVWRTVHAPCADIRCPSCTPVCSIECAVPLHFFRPGKGMPSLSSPPSDAGRVMREKIIDQALARTVSGAATSNAIAEATVNALRLLHAELASLIGSRAAGALYVRSVHLTRPLFPWLSQVVETPDALFSTLHSDLCARHANEARQAGAGLLRTFADLLVTLIGEPLTHRLLRSAWALPADDEPSGSKRDE